jgi:hypothetical protein
VRGEVESTPGTCDVGSEGFRGIGVEDGSSSDRDT